MLTGLHRNPIIHLCRRRGLNTVVAHSTPRVCGVFNMCFRKLTARHANIQPVKVDSTPRSNRSFETVTLHRAYNIQGDYIKKKYPLSGKAFAGMS